MMGAVFIGVDVGSTGVKVGIFDETLLHPVATGSAHYVAHQPVDGVSEHDGGLLYDAACRAIRSAVVASDLAPSRFAGLAVCGMMSGTIPIGMDGQPTGPYTTTLDQRASKWLMDGVRKHGSAIGEQTGSAQPVFAAKIQWIRDEMPDVFRRTAKFMTAGSFVASKLAGLSGSEGFIDPTYLWMTGLADVKMERWSGELCRLLGIDEDCLPSITPSESRIGTLDASTAACTGLVAGMPVYAGCGDQLAGFLGAGLLQPGMAADVAGTYAVFAVTSASFGFDNSGSYETIKAAGADIWVTQSFVAGGGLNNGWFLNSVLNGIRLDEKLAGLEELRDGLEEAARLLPPGSENLIFVPHLGGQALPPRPDVRGAWIGLNWAHRREHLYRAMLEGLAYSHSLSLQRRRQADGYAEPSLVITFGGGARSRLWTQIKADVLGIPFRVLDHDSPATRGCAILAAAGAGKSLAASAAVEELYNEAAVQPSPDAHAIYSALTGDYAEAVDALYGAYHALSRRRMSPS
jgi:xylulokinase